MHDVKPVATLYNEEERQVLFMFEDVEKNPQWKELMLRYSGDRSFIEVVHEGDIVGKVINLKLVMQFMSSKEFYYGWVDPENNLIRQRMVKCDRMGLMPS